MTVTIEATMMAILRLAGSRRRGGFLLEYGRDIIENRVMIGRASVFNRNFFNTKTKPAFALEREVFAFAALPARNGTMLDMKPAILVASILSLVGGLSLLGQDPSYSLQKDIPYQTDDLRKADPYIAERCVLDLYAPKNRKGFSTIVWFHGGGLKNGNKSVPEGFREKGVAVVAINYRLHPKVKAPVYIQDAAASVAWVFENIEKYGGDASRIFVSGSSAGGYLTSMVGLDKRWLGTHGIDANRIAGLIPLAGHTITHFTVRAERGIEGTKPIIDDLAPLYHVRADAPPFLMITGDRELEMLGRYEENAYMMRMMRVAGHKDARIMELDGYGHSPRDAAAPLILKEVRRVEKMLK